MSFNRSTPHKLGNKPLPALTSLRFFVAVLVVTFHYMPREVGFMPLFRNIVNHGYVGVSIFFVLSGFILAYNYRDEQFSLREVRWRFYTRRIARIYPAMAASTLLHLPLFLYSLIVSLPPGSALLRGGAVTLLTLSLIQSWIPYSLGQLNAPSWTIAVEMFLYSSLPRSVLWLRSQSTRARLVTIFILVTLCWMPGIWLSHHPNTITHHDSIPDWLISPYPLKETWLNCFPLFHFPQFLLGALAWFSVADSRISEIRPTRAIAILAVLGISTLVVLAVPRGALPVLDMALNHGALAPVFSLAFIVFSLSPTAIPILGSPALVTLGEASYALYIFQMPIMALWALFLKRSHLLEAKPGSRFIIGLFILTGVALWCWRWEQKVRPRMVAWLERQWPWRPNLSLE